LAHDPIAMEILEQAGMHQEARFLDALQEDGAWQSVLSYAAFPTVLRPTSREV
jgi:hypothetical protein